jgi:hypothetical protein
MLLAATTNFMETLQNYVTSLNNPVLNEIVTIFVDIFGNVFSDR